MKLAGLKAPQIYVNGNLFDHTSEVRAVRLTEVTTRTVLSETVWTVRVSKLQFFHQDQMHSGILINRTCVCHFTRFFIFLSPTVIGIAFFVVILTVLHILHRWKDIQDWCVWMEFFISNHTHSLRLRNNSFTLFTYINLSLQINKTKKHHWLGALSSKSM